MFLVTTHARLLTRVANSQASQAYQTLFQEVEQPQRQLARCTAERLADTVLAGSAMAGHVVSVIPGAVPLSLHRLSLLRAAFSPALAPTLATCAPWYQRPVWAPDAPLGINIKVSVGADVDLVRAVAGCTHLSLRFQALPEALLALLCDALRHHTALRYLRLSGDGATLAVLARTASTSCARLTVLLYLPSLLSPENSLEICRKLVRLRCVHANLNDVNVSADVLAPLATLPRLVYLHLEGLVWTEHGVSALVSLLAKRKQPIRALRLATHSAQDSALPVLFAAAGRAVLSQLWWLELDGFDRYEDVFAEDLAQLTDQVLPELRHLRHFSIRHRGLGPAGEEVVCRAIAALPRPELMCRLLFHCHNPGIVQTVVFDRLRAIAPRVPGLQHMLLPPPVYLQHVDLHACWPMLEVLDLENLATNVPASELAACLGRMLHLRRLVLPRSRNQAALLVVLRDSVPLMKRLFHLVIPSGVTLDHDLTHVLARQVLPALPELGALSMEIGIDQRHLLRRLFADRPAFSMLHLYLATTSVRTCLVPLQAMRTCVCVRVFWAHWDLSHPLACNVYYTLPEHEARPEPCSVQPLLDLAASTVLTDLPADVDVGAVPHKLTRQVLRRDLLPCDQCGTYRRLAQLLIVARRHDNTMIEVPRCRPCTLAKPAQRFPLPLSVSTE